MGSSFSLMTSILPLSMPTKPVAHEVHPVLLFDGVCNLCDSSIQFIIDRDPESRFRFASLQSDVGKRLASENGVAAQVLDTLVLIDHGQAFVRSDAVLRAASLLGRPWSWFSIFRVVPRPLRDGVYSVIARNRIRWFGERDACRIPTPDLQARSLSS